TFSDHSSHWLTQTVGSGSDAVGSGVGLCIWPWKVNSGCCADNPAPRAIGVGGVDDTGGTSATAGIAAARNAAPATSATRRDRAISTPPYAAYVAFDAKYEIGHDASQGRAE